MWGLMFSSTAKKKCGVWSSDHINSYNIDYTMCSIQNRLNIVQHPFIYYTGFYWGKLVGTKFLWSICRRPLLLSTLGLVNYIYIYISSRIKIYRWLCCYFLFRILCYSTVHTWHGYIHGLVCIFGLSLFSLFMIYMQFLKSHFLCITFKK